MEKREEVFANLGPLERSVLQALWQSAGAVSVREVCEMLDGRLAYTTIMTTLDRLYKKGVLLRRRNGRAFLYEPGITAADFERTVAQRVLSQMLGRNAQGVEPLLACIVDTVSQHDRDSLDELDRLIQAKRRELNA